MNPQSIATEAIPTDIKTNQLQKGDASLLEAISHWQSYYHQARTG